MRLSATRLAAAALAVGLAAAALAQSSVPGVLPGLDKANLLQNKSVQDELKITPEQHARFRKIARDFEQEHKDEIARAEKDPRKKLELQTQALETLAKAVEDVLQPEQVKRLGQIELQLRGIWGLVRSETQKKLGLSDKQKLEIRDIVTFMEKGIREVGKDEPRRDQAGEVDRRRAEAFKKIHALNQDAFEKALDRLTEEQRKTWKDLVGEPFELKVDLPRPAK